MSPTKYTATATRLPQQTGANDHTIHTHQQLEQASSRRPNLTNQPMQCRGARSLVDDSALGRGVVLSRAAASLRSIDTQPHRPGDLSARQHRDGHISSLRRQHPATLSRQPSRKPPHRHAPTRHVHHTHTHTHTHTLHRTPPGLFSSSTPPTHTTPITGRNRFAL